MKSEVVSNQVNTINRQALSALVLAVFYVSVEISGHYTVFTPDVGGRTICKHTLSGIINEWLTHYTLLPLAKPI